MKNFTKQNFKTNPLWIRLLIMTFMLLAGAGNMWAANITGGKVFYLNPGPWNTDNAWFAMYLCNGSSSAQWVKLTETNGVYKGVVPSGQTHKNIIFCRMDPAKTALDWGSKWNQTADLTWTSGDLYTITGWGGSDGNWSTYTPPCNVSVSISKSPDQSVYLTGETVTLTATTANETSFAWKEGSTQVSTNKIYDYTTNTVGSVTLKAVATASCGSDEEEVTLSFVNQKKIVVKCKGADNIHLYTWNGTNDDGTKTWPGTTTSTKDGEYYVWEISTESPINIIFNKGQNQNQTKDISNLQVGYEYTFTWDGGKDSELQLPNNPAKLPKPCNPADVLVTSGPNDICFGGTTSFTYTAVQGANVTWSMQSAPNAYTITDNNGTVTVTHKGSTTVNGENKLLYTVTGDNDFCSESGVDSGKTITILAKPTITADNKEQEICQDATATLSVNESMTSYLWSTGATTQSISVGETGTYTVTATDANGCESNQLSFTVTVNPRPDAPVLTNPTGSACETASGTVNLNTLADPTGTVKWYDNIEKPIADANVLIDNAGTFTYTAKAVSNGCESKNGTTFTLKVKANASASNYAIKSGSESKVYTGSALGLTSDEIVVSNNAGAVESIYFKQGNNTVTPQNVGEYEVYVTTAATNDICAGDIKIGTFVVSCKTPSITMTVTEVTYNGSAQKPNVTIEGGATPTLRYGDNTYANGPTNAGNYAVTVSASLNGNYCALTDANAGEFVISKKTPATEDFTYTATAVYSGSGIGANVTLKSSYSGAGRIYTYYKTSTTDYTETLPINAGEYTVAISLDEGDNFSASREKLVLGTFTITCPKPAQPQLTIAEGEKVKVCEGQPNTDGYITISNYNSYSNCKFYLGSVSNENEITTNKVAIDVADTYTIIVKNACGETAENSIAMGEDILTPTITNAAITAEKDAVCVNTGTTLTASATTDKGTLSYLWNTNATTASIETGNLTENTTYTVTITATNAGCAVSIPTVLSKTITVNPLSAPTISASANSGVNAIDLTINVQDAGCAPNYTLGYRIKQSDDLEYSENQVVKASTTETQASTTIEGLITGVEYVIQAYIINGYNNNEVFYTDPITCTVLASENCDVPSANYIEILANNDENLQLYAWVEGTGTTPLGGWSGKTRDTWYEVNSTGYSVWKIESSDPVYIIFNKGDNSKTTDIKGSNDEGLKPGYRYIFDVNLNTWDYTLQNQTLIADPEVETVSATPVRIDETKSNVTLVGRIIKRGCADIRSYGFQYKLIDAKDYSNLQVGTGDIEPGSTFTGSLELGLGTYYLRARVENENGSEAYGEEIRVTIAERDLTIAAVDDDKDVDTDTYYDFVGLYMSSVTKPTTVDIKSYTWYKDGNEYNPTFTASNLYGETYINTNGTNNIRPNEIGKYKLKVQLSNGDIFESNEIEVSKASKVNASSILNASNRTLPVISVRTNEDFPKCQSGSYPSAQADKLKKKRSVDVKIFDKDGKLYYDRKARMNYRGSSSLNFVKKSYAFCPGGDMCGDVEKGLDYVITEKVNMFNLGASDKDWVLYAAAADPSLMRNRIVFDTYAAMTNKWGVKSMFVELVVDGNYKGVYVFMDKITKNKNRVNITAADGFIVKFDKTDTADRYVDGKQEKGDEKTFMTERTGIQGISTYGTTVDQMFEIEYPEKDDNKGTWNNIVASIKDKFETFETALEEGNYSKVREIIDYDSWADWFIISEYIKNQDAYRASCIFVYNGEKIEARPLWDQELSMNNTSHTSHNCDDTNSLLITTASIYGDDFPAPFWFTGHDGASIEGGLLKDGCFISLVQTKLADYLKEGAALYAGEDAKDKRGPILKLAHDFNEELVSKTEGQTSAQEREDKFWVGKSRSSAECGGTHSYSQSSYSNEYGNVKNWILGDHDENLTSILGGMSGEMTSGISITTSLDNAIVTPWIPITVTVNVADDAEYIYDDSSITQGIELDVDKAITSKSGNKYTYTFPRPADWNVDNVETAIEQIVYPINAQLKVKDTTCPGVSNETQIRIRLRDEGNDICGELIEQ